MAKKEKEKLPAEGVGGGEGEPKKRRARSPSANPADYADDGYVVWVGKKPKFFKEISEVKAYLEEVKAKVLRSRKPLPVTLGELGRVTIQQKVQMDYSLSAEEPVGTAVEEPAP